MPHVLSCKWKSQQARPRFRHCMYRLIPTVSLVEITNQLYGKKGMFRDTSGFIVWVRIKKINDQVTSCVSGWGHRHLFIFRPLRVVNLQQNGKRSSTCGIQLVMQRQENVAYTMAAVRSALWTLKWWRQSGCAFMCCLLKIGENCIELHVE